jgi:hypothetical protein
MAGPRRNVQGLLPPVSSPPFARGPSPAATAAKPIPPPADTRLPPALTLVPRRTATRRPNGPDARIRRLVRRNVEGLTANSVPFYPPPTPRGRPALSILHSGALHPPKGLPSSVAGCVYGVGQGVNSGRHALFQAMKNRLSRSGGCRLRWTLRTPCGPSRLAKQVRLDDYRPSRRLIRSYRTLAD